MAGKYKVDEKFLHEYEDQFLEEFCLRQAQSRYFISVISKFQDLNNKKILCIGPGLGTLEYNIQKEFKNVSFKFFEPNQNVKKHSKRLFHFSEDVFLEDLEEDREKYDLIICFYVYGWIPEKKVFWEIVEKRLKKRAHAYVLNMNRNSIYSKITSTNQEFPKIKKKLFRKNLKLVRVIPSKFPSYLTYFTKDHSHAKAILRYAIYVLEGLLFRPTEKICVFKKS